MAKEVTALKVRTNLGEVLEQVFYQGEEYIIKRGNKPMAVLIPLAEFENYKKQRAREMTVFKKIRSRVKKFSSKEIEADVRVAVKAVRKGA